MFVHYDHVSIVLFRYLIYSVLVNMFQPIPQSCKSPFKYKIAIHEVQWAYIQHYKAHYFTRKWSYGPIQTAKVNTDVVL